MGKSGSLSDLKQTHISIVSPEFAEFEGRRILCHARPGVDGYPAPVEVPFGTDLLAVIIGGLMVKTDCLN